MTQFGICLGISPREPARRAGELAREAEDCGIDALWILDSQLIMRDVYVCLAAAALSTQRIKLGTGVTMPQTRHITVTANAIGTVDELSGGRAILGVGVGDSAVFPLGMKPVKVDELRTFVQQVRTLLKGEPLDLGAGQVQLKAARPDLPIFISASQPRMLQLAGEVADGVIMMGFAAPQLVEHQLGFLRQGIRNAGRSDGDVFVDYWATMSIGDDGDAPLADVKSWAAGQARWLNTWKDVPPALGRFREEAARAAREYDFSEHLSVAAGHSNTVSDDFARLAAIAGTLEHCTARVRELIPLGIDRVTITLLSGGRRQRLERIGQLISVVRSKQTGVAS